MRLLTITCFASATVTTTAASAFVTTTTTLPQQDQHRLPVRHRHRLFESAKQRETGTLIRKDEKEDGSSAKGPERLNLEKFEAELDQFLEELADEESPFAALPWKFQGKHEIQSPASLPEKTRGEKFEAALDQFLEEPAEEESPATAPAVPELAEEEWSLATTSTVPWKFQGEHDIHCQVSLPEMARGEGDEKQQQLPVVLLVHGFGASVVPWRETVKSLTSAGYTVCAMDLLGHGRSAKPDDVHYLTDLWARQLDDFCREKLHDLEETGRQIVLVGNSVGSLVALLAATGEFADGDAATPYIKQHVAGIGMFNCGIGMNVHSMTRDPKWNPLQRFLLNFMFDALETHVFSNSGLLEWILDNVVTKDLLRNALKELYPSSSAAINDELVDSFYHPAKDDTAAAARVLSQILTNDAGPTPMEVYAKHYSAKDKNRLLNSLPVHVMWGDADTVTPIDGVGEVAQFYGAAADDDANEVTFEFVPGAGHLLFDEAPGAANGSLLRWLRKL